MPKLGPIKRDDLIYYLRKLDFVGPLWARKHPVMKKGNVQMTIPNPHVGDISVGLLRKILRDAGISREEWEAL
jgi:predicted RNA binding protein YcfA (HicA-like mRNA interferase family)